MHSYPRELRLGLVDYEGKMPLGEKGITIDIYWELYVALTAPVRSQRCCIWFNTNLVVSH